MSFFSIVMLLVHKLKCSAVQAGFVPTPPVVEFTLVFQVLSAVFHKSRSGVLMTGLHCVNVRVDEDYVWGHASGCLSSIDVK